MLPVKVPAGSAEDPIGSAVTVTCASPVCGLVLPAGGLNRIQFLPAGLGSGLEVREKFTWAAGVTANVRVCAAGTAWPSWKLSWSGEGVTLSTGAAETVKLTGTSIGMLVVPPLGVTLMLP